MEHSVESRENTPVTESAALESGSAAPSEQAREWISPGVSVRKRWLTGIGVLLASVLFFWIALSEGAPALVSTLIGIVFIGGFVGYLRVVAPTPFTLALDGEGITRTDRGGQPAVIPWANVAKIKEEYFKNGTSVSVTVYKRVGERGLHRAYVVYRDDIPRFDDFREAVRAHLPETTPWIREQVHE